MKFSSSDIVFLLVLASCFLASFALGFSLSNVLIKYFL